MARRSRALPDVLAIAFAVTPASAGVAPDPRPVFGAQQSVRSEKIDLFPKWTGMLDRYFAEARLADRPCSDAVPNRCHLQRWKAYLETLRGRDRLSILQDINRFANVARYVTDLVNYGVPDYWATPRQFLIKDGDCEDYAIAKFMSLRALGFDNDEMRIVVLNDLNLRTAHAVLIVYIDGVAWLLDNQVQEVARADAVRHYRAIFAINETAWWLYRY
jgi:predicted transglutaminase-like cysteine proteinase